MDLLERLAFVFEQRLTNTPELLDLVARAQKKNKAALAELFQLPGIQAMSRDSIKRFASGFGPQSVDDFMSAIKLKLLGQLSKFNPKRSSFPTWFFNVARSAVRNEADKAARIRSQLANDLLLGIPAGRKKFKDVSAQEIDAIQKEIKARIKKAISKLPKKQRDIMNLRFGKRELTFKEIAVKLGTNSENIRRELAKVIPKLKKDPDILALEQSMEWVNKLELDILREQIENLAHPD